MTVIMHECMCMSGQGCVRVQQCERECVCVSMDVWAGMSDYALGSRVGTSQSTAHLKLLTPNELLLGIAFMCQCEMTPLSST